MKATGDAWAGFWQDEPSATSGATLANLPRALQERLDAPWCNFARQLPPKAKVLDLATGGGIVLDLLYRQRRDLNLVGVDMASNLPRRTGMKLKGGISTDRLPFTNDSFDAITSRFGIEYGPLEKSASEAARVLRHKGQLCLLVHHSESEVIRHNRARSEALHWAAHQSGWVEKALSVANARRTMRLPTPPAFRAAPEEAAAQFPGQSVAWEFLTGLNQLLEAGAPGEQIAHLRGRADGELGRLDSLLAAACGTERLARLAGAFTDAGIALDPLQTIAEPGGKPLAWRIEGRKP